MKILILGGTGAMGKHLVELLAKCGNDVFVTSRQVMKSKGKINYLKGNAHDISFLNTLLNQKWDAIVDFMVYTTIEFKEKMELFLNSTEQYIFLSSSRVYANSDSPIAEDNSRLLDISEDKDFLLSDDYSLEKARQEDLLKNSSNKNWTIIRPYITYSDNRLQLGVLEKEEWLYSALQGRSIVIPQEILDSTTTLTFGRDVSKVIVDIIGNKNTLTESINLTTDETIIWEEVLEIYLRVIEKITFKKPRVKKQSLEKFVIWKPFIYQIYYDRLYNRSFDNSKLKKFAKMNSFKGIENGLEQALTEFLKSRNFNNINWEQQALKDRSVGERASLSEMKGFNVKVKYLIFRYFYNTYKQVKKILK